MSRKTFTFGGLNSGTYGIYISGSGVFNSPSRVVEMLDVQGRNGQLTIDGGRYANIEVRYPSGIYGVSRADFADKIRQFRNAMGAKIGYQRLTDDYNADEFRLGLFSAGITTSEVKSLRMAQFEVAFNCKPQRFLVSGETATTFTVNGTITNPTLFDAMPMLEIHGKGTVGIGDNTITLEGVAGQTIYIDCDIMEAWKLSGGAKVNANDLVQYAGNKFPTLKAGANSIALGTGITSVKITPRWWRL